MGEQQKKKRGRKPNPFKNLSVLELRALELQIATEVRSRRLRTVLKTLAGLKDKSFNVRRYEADLSDALYNRRYDRVDEALDLLEAKLDIVD